MGTGGILLLLAWALLLAITAGIVFSLGAIGLILVRNLVRNRRPPSSGA